MANYTSIEQSKKLLGLGLNPETADMVYPMLYHRAIDGGGKSLSDKPEIKVILGKEDIPCWSIGALSKLLECCSRCETSLRVNKRYNIFATIGDNVFRSWDDCIKGYGSILDAYYNVVCWLLKNKCINERN